MKRFFLALVLILAGCVHGADKATVYGTILFPDGRPYQSYMLWDSKSTPVEFQSTVIGTSRIRVNLDANGYFTTNFFPGLYQVTLKGTNNFADSTLYIQIPSTNSYEVSTLVTNTFTPQIQYPPTNWLMVGATALSDGRYGFAPTPVTGDRLKFLRGDGTWVAVAGGTATEFNTNQFVDDVTGTIKSGVALTNPVISGTVDSTNIQERINTASNAVVALIPSTNYFAQTSYVASAIQAATNGLGGGGVSGLNTNQFESASVGNIRSGALLTNINAATFSNTTSFIDVKRDFLAAGDGTTDDTTKIQAAINSASNNATIYIPSGSNFKITEALTISKPLTILGGGKITQTGTQKAGFAITATNVVVDSIWLYNSRGGADFTGGASGARGITLTNAHNAIIRNSIIENWGEGCVKLINGKNVTVQNCAIIGVGTAGGLVAGTNGNLGVYGDGSGVGCEGLKVLNCTISDLAQGIFTGYNWTDVMIRGNYFTNIVGQLAVYMDNASNVNISDNTINGTGAGGIKLQINSFASNDAVGIKIAGNVIYNTGTDCGILLIAATAGETKYFKDVIIANNVIGATGIDGIRIDQADGFSIVNNSIYSTTWFGVRSTTKLRNGKVSGNVFKDTVYTPVFLILEGTGYYVTVDNNTFIEPATSVSPPDYTYASAMYLSTGTWYVHGNKVISSTSPFVNNISTHASSVVSIYDNEFLASKSETLNGTVTTYRKSNYLKPANGAWTNVGNAHITGTNYVGALHVTNTITSTNLDDKFLTTSNGLYALISSGGIPSLNGSGTNLTLYGPITSTNLEARLLSVSNAIQPAITSATNILTNFIATSIQAATNGLTGGGGGPVSSLTNVVMYQQVYYNTATNDPTSTQIFISLTNAETVLVLTNTILSTNISIFTTNQWASTNGTLYANVMLTQSLTNSIALSFPSTWKWQGVSAPTALASNAVALLSLKKYITSGDTVETNIIAGYNVTP